MSYLQKSIVLAALLLPFGNSQAQAVKVGTIDVGTPLLLVEILNEQIVNFPNSLPDTRIIIQVTNFSQTNSYRCSAQIGFFSLQTGAASSFPVNGEIAVNANSGGPFIIVETVLKANTGLGNTIYNDSASCSLVTPGGGGGGGGGSGGGDGGPELRGAVNFSVDPGAGGVDLGVDTIANPSATRTTGSLRLELWALQTPYSGTGGVSGRRMTVANLPSACGDSARRLGPGQSCVGVRTSTGYSAPNPGTYSATLFLTEFSSTCTASDGFCIADFVNFAERFTIGSGGNGGSGGGVEIIGGGSAATSFTSPTAGTVQFLMDELRNTSTVRTTGTLRLELWATTAMYQGGSINGNRIFASQLPPGCPGQLAPGGGCLNISISRNLENLPPSGTYFLTVIVSEFDSQNCQAADQFCITTARTAGSFTIPTANINNPAPTNNSGGGAAAAPSGGGGGSGAFMLLGLALLGRARFKRQQGTPSSRRDKSNAE